MTDIRVEKLADLLVNYSIGVKNGDRVVIEGNTMSEPLVKAVYAKVLQAGGNPLLMVQPAGAEEIYYKYASEEQLQYVPEPSKLIIETFDVRIVAWGIENTRALTSVDPAKTVLHSRSRRELMKTGMQRSASGELRWVVALYPTNAPAQDAEMSLSEYEDFVYGACMPDMDDPIGYWRRFSVRQQKIVDWLKGKKRVHVTAPETDLSLSIEGRKFINCDGKYNMPDGEVFTGPVEDSMQGHVCFSYPAIYDDREVAGARLWFENGKVVRASAEKNEEYLIKTLDTDEGSRYVGEFAIGTNEGITRFTRQILFDEKINGSFHMALGTGYPETGSCNESSIHWDMVCDLRQGGEIRVDNELLYKDGKIVINF
ncbi:MAG: aminopeptidase [Dehalococcoidales bacterium]|nr:aminopeptidase [Dehalococcoidales bacterium]